MKTLPPDSEPPAREQPGITRSHASPSAVVEALRTGAVPREGLTEFSVGRARFVDALVRDLAFVGAGGYKVRLLCGDWGYGKTHLLSLFAERALEEGFAVSHVELHAKEAPLERADIIAASIVRNTRFPGGRRLEQYLRDWATESELLGAAEISTWLAKTSRNLEFRSILRAALTGPARPGERDIVGDAVRWLSGGPPTAELTKITGVRAGLSQAIATDLLTSFLDFIRATGPRGLVLLLDEAEAITSLTRASKRDEANQTLRRLIDNPDDRSGCELVFATTRRFVEDKERGARAYPALWERLRTQGPAGIFNPRATVLILDGLAPNELVELGMDLQRLHNAAYGWSSDLQPADMSRFGEAVFGSSGTGPPRRFVRAVIAALDVLELSPTTRPDSLVELVASIPDDD